MKHIITTCFGGSAVGTTACVAGATQAATGTITDTLEIAYLILGIIGAIGTIAGLAIGIYQKIKKDAADGVITPEEAAQEAEQVAKAAEVAQTTIENVGKKKEKRKK